MKVDYIIVGAGSAGCVLANRLSADPSNSVLLIEAGGKDKHPLIHIPGGYMRLHHSKVDWNCFWTTPQRHLESRRIYHPRGKVLGGCSSTNAMVYIRGQKEDYEHWKNLGNLGWGFEDILPYFKKSEHNEQLSSSYHCSNGPLNVTYATKYRTILASSFIDACNQSGISENDDFNGNTQEGVGWFQYTMKNFKRHSTAQAFLLPVLKRKNLNAITKTLVGKIIIEKDKAIGVEIFKGNRSVEKIYANKKIILSTGAFASPQLLMLSGIGPRDVLRKAGIETIQELPGVGENLQDHLFYPVSSLTDEKVSNNHYIPIHRQLGAALDYFVNKDGPLTLGPLEACAFLKSDPNLKRPDIQFQFTPTHIGNDYKTNPFDLSTFPHTNGYSILPTQMRPWSRGKISIQSKSPEAPLEINPNYLSDQRDKETMVRACKIALGVLEQPAFNSVRLSTHCPKQRDSDDDLLQHIQRSAECVYHPVGTCKMGNDEMAVVNNTLNVHGIENLKIADASIMPTITSGNTNAPVIMIGEKCADYCLDNL